MSEEERRRVAPGGPVRRPEGERRLPATERSFRARSSWGADGNYAIRRGESTQGEGKEEKKGTALPPVGGTRVQRPAPVTREGSPGGLPGRSALPTPTRVPPSPTPSPQLEEEELLEVEESSPGNQQGETPEAFVSSGDWTDAQEVEDTPSPEGRKYWSGGSGFRVTPRDVEILRFLGRYRYAQATQVARYIQTSPKAAQIRLSKMGKVGLVRREDVTQGQSVWTPTAGGLSVADLGIRAIGEGQISYVTMAHTLGLVNIGIELELGGADLLGEKDLGWPHLNRVSEMGEALQGETVLTEREISQGQQRWKREKEKGQLRSEVYAALRQWQMEGDMESLSPELKPGNEGMFVLYSTAQASLSGSGEHVPDMVVTRPRDENGKPSSIAVELELVPKPTAEWKRILKAYANNDMYGKLIYFTHKEAIAHALMKINNDDIKMPAEKFAVRMYKPSSGRQPFWG